MTEFRVKNGQSRYFPSFSRALFEVWIPVCLLFAMAYPRSSQFHRGKGGRGHARSALGQRAIDLEKQIETGVRIEGPMFPLCSGRGK
jgi:hypothetical protein